MSDYTVYIDEAGDLGIGRGTQWFVLSAVIVKKTYEPRIRATISRIKGKLNVKEIHLRKISDFIKRAFIVRELADEPFVYMNVIVDTNKFDKEKIPSPLTAYNYVCKYLLQRVSWYLQEVGGVADVLLSARGTSRDGELIAYIKEKLLPYPDNDISQEAFDKISAKSAAEWDMLQLADVCATTLFLAYEKNWFGATVPCYSYVLQDHLYKRGGKVLSYGIKFFRNEMQPNKEEQLKTRICTKKERLPERLPHE